MVSHPAWPQALNQVVYQRGRLEERRLVVGQPSAAVALEAVTLVAEAQPQPTKAAWIPKELPLPPTFVI